jgi:hypothetical protein
MINKLTGSSINQILFTLLIVLLLAGSQGYCETFSFVVIADPHIDGNANRKDNFENTVNWIIENKKENDIELVFVLGDIAWGGSKRNRNLAVAKQILDRLNNAGIPYIPVMGDNEVQTRCERQFQNVFEPQFQFLSKTFKNWQKAPVKPYGMCLQNFSFDYKDCHFVCPDFNPRKTGHEGGELHDFPGGTWPWFKNDIENCSKSRKENIVIMTHIGMFRTGFDVSDQYLFSKEQMKKIKRFLFNYREYVDSNYAGHLHQNWNMVVWSGLFIPIYYVRITDETWYDTQWPETNDQELTVRLVQVNNDGPKITFHQHIHDIDGEN